MKIKNWRNSYKKENIFVWIISKDVNQEVSPFIYFTLLIYIGSDKSESNYWLGSSGLSIIILVLTFVTPWSSQ